jgi:hypothetical protein
MPSIDAHITLELLSWSGKLFLSLIIICKIIQLKNYKRNTNIKDIFYYIINQFIETLSILKWYSIQLNKTLIKIYILMK